MTTPSRGGGPGSAGYEDLLWQLSTEQRAVDALRSERAQCEVAVEPAYQRLRRQTAHETLQRRRVELDRTRRPLEQEDEQRRDRMLAESAKLAAAADALDDEADRRRRTLVEIAHRAGITPPRMAEQPPADVPDSTEAADGAKAALARAAATTHEALRLATTAPLPRLPELLRNLLVWLPAAAMSYALIQLVDWAHAGKQVSLPVFLALLAAVPLAGWGVGALVREYLFTPPLPDPRLRRHLRLGLGLCYLAMLAQVIPHRGG